MKVFTLICPHTWHSLKSQAHIVIARNASCLSANRHCHRKQRTNGSQHFRVLGQTRIGVNYQLQRFASVAVAAASSDASAVATAGVSHSSLVGFWQSLSNSTPVAYMQQTLTEIHDYTGLPWWASIVLSTVLFRTVVTLPLAIYQYKIMARIERITLEMPAIVAELKKEAAVAMKKFNWTEKHTRLVYNRSLKKQWNALIVRDNCHPAKTLIVLWGQIPLWICQSMALRNLVHMLPDPTQLQAQIIYTQMTIGGFGWIPNLTEVDSSYILPVTLGLLNLGIIEVQSVLRKTPSTRMQKYATNVFRVLSLVMIPVACSVPSALCVYWVSSSAYGLAQNLLLATPTVRRVVGIPQTNSEVPNPYERLWTEMKIRTGQVEAPPQQIELKAKEENNSQKSKDSTVK